jgi:hypothetical protein
MSNPNPNPQRTPRGPNRFRKTELTRSVRGTLAAGLPIERVEVDPITGKINVIPGKYAVDDKGKIILSGGGRNDTEVENWINQHAHKG